MICNYPGGCGEWAASGRKMCQNHLDRQNVYSRDAYRRQRNPSRKQECGNCFEPGHNRATCEHSDDYEGIAL